MSIWENLTAAVGIGACQVAVSLNAAEACWNEPISGMVYLKGGRVAQQLHGLDVAVVEHWTTSTFNGKTTTTNHHYREYQKAQLLAAFEVQPGAEHAFPFQLTVPWGGLFNHEWMVRAAADIPLAVDPHARGLFHLLPARIFLDTAQILSEVARLPVHAWHNQQGGVRVDMVATGEAGKVLDGIRLHMVQNGYRLSGAVEVNPQERSVTDVLKSLTRADLQRTPFDIAVGDHAATRALFQQALRPYLDSLAHLPLPAAAPAPRAEQFPLPSQETPSQ